MIIRAATAEDVGALLDVARAADLAWHGETAHERTDVEELFRVADRIVVAVPAVLPESAGDRGVVAFAACWPQGAEVTGRPDADLHRVYPDLLAALHAQGVPEVQFAAEDRAMVAALDAAGWSFAHVTHHLARSVRDVDLPAPAWPEDVALRDWAPDQADAVHRMIYVDAAWSDVEGHHERTVEQWRSYFVEQARDAPVVAWRDGLPVGAALTQRLSTGEGHIAQIAVARTERGDGLGRALVTEAFRRLAAHDDVSSLGLEVIATNDTALDLYLSMGLVRRSRALAYSAPGGPPA